MVLPKRPISITVISILLIVFGLLAILSDSLNVFLILALPSTRFPIPYSVEVFIMYLGSFTILLSGIVMLNGFNFSRQLIITWSIVSLLIYNDSTLFRFIFLIVLLAFLFLPSANQYFSSAAAAQLNTNQSKLKL